MDNVDREYFNNIRDALNSKNAERLSSLTTMSIGDAEEWIMEWGKITSEMMGKIRAGRDTEEETQELHDILFEICRKYSLSGNTIRR